MYVIRKTPCSVHKKPPYIGPGLCGLRRITLPRTPVNKGKKEDRAKRGMLGTTRRLKALGIFASILAL
jgi:hypothetical protein